MEFEKAAEHPELTVSMTAITATGFFEHGELVVLSFSMVQIWSRMSSTASRSTEASNLNRSPASRPPELKRAPLIFCIEMLAVGARA